MPPVSNFRYSRPVADHHAAQTPRVHCRDVLRRSHHPAEPIFASIEGGADVIGWIGQVRLAGTPALGCPRIHRELLAGRGVWLYPLHSE